MMQMTSQASQTTPAGTEELSLGEIAWKNLDTGEEGRMVVRASKCTIGSHPDSSICLPEPVASQHAVLTFGKRFTLLKAPGFVQIGDRTVRESLIDEPTELAIGPWRITVLPARSSERPLATVIPPSSIGETLRAKTPPTTRSTPSSPPSFMGDWTSPLPEEAPQDQKREEEEKRERDLVERARLERERLEKERLEQERLERERLEQARLEQERAEQERLEQERLERERAELARLEQERLEQERLERERLEHERLEQERLEQERAELARLERERAEQARLERERLEQERLEQERLERERAELARLEQERVEQERLEWERAERERLEAEHAERARLELERVEQERAELERLVELELAQAEQNEARIRAIELSIDQLHEGLEYIHTAVQEGGQANEKNGEVYREELNRLGSQMATDIQTQLHSQLEKRDGEWGAAITRNFESIEAHITSLGTRFEALAADVASKLIDAESKPVEAPVPPELLANLNGVDERLDSIAERMEGTIAQLRQELHEVAKRSQENYEYVLAHIQEVQSQPRPYPSEAQDNPPSYHQEPEETSYDQGALEPLAQRPIAQRSIEEFSEIIDPNWEDAAPIQLEPSDEIESRLDQVLQHERAWTQEPTDASEKNAPYDAQGYEPPTGNIEVEMDSLSERLRRMIAEAESEEMAEFSDTNVYASEEPDAPPDAASVLSQYGFSDLDPHQEEPEYEEEASQYEASQYEPSPYEESQLEEPLDEEIEEPLSYGGSNVERELSHRAPELEQDEVDGSIEAYMQQLLQRVKSGQDAPLTSVPEPPKPVQRSRAEILQGGRRAETVGFQPVGGIETDREPSRIMTPDEFTPRNQAPERQQDLSVLRELANNNARRAINTSDAKKINAALLFKVSIVAVALVVGIVVLSINKSGGIIIYGGAFVAFLVAGLYGYDCAIHAKKLGLTQRLGRK